MIKIDDNNETMGEINNAINQKPGTWTEEEFYDKEIVPLFTQLAEKCASRNIPYLIHIICADDGEKMTAGTSMNTCKRNNTQKMNVLGNILAEAEKIRYQEQPDRHPSQHVKAMRCWLYQSCEGDCDHDPLFLAVGTILKKETLAVASEIAGRPIDNVSQGCDIVDEYIRENDLKNTWD